MVKYAAVIYSKGHWLTSLCVCVFFQGLYQTSLIRNIRVNNYMFCIRMTLSYMLPFVVPWSPPIPLCPLPTISTNINTLTCISMSIPKQQNPGYLGDNGGIFARASLQNPPPPALRPTRKCLYYEVLFKFAPSKFCT